jgi:CheY-like chemotaxis protein
MPEMNGFEATRFIRDKMNSHIPIIALTADVTTTDLKKCIAVGMNDYISKPIDEKLLYVKIVDLLKKPDLIKNIGLLASKSKCTDLTYLKDRTKGNPELMRDMIALYLEQTLPLINTMKQSLSDKDWDSLYTAVHKIIPSFYIMGIHIDYENIGKKIQEYVKTQKHLDEIQELVLMLEKVCSQACKELEEAYNLIK